MQFRILAFKIYPNLHLGAIHAKQSVALLKQILIQVLDKWPYPAVHVQTASTGVTAHDCNLCPTHSAQGENEIAGWLDT